MYTDEDLDGVHTLLKGIVGRYEATSSVSSKDQEALVTRYGEMTGEQDAPFAFTIATLMDFLADEDDFEAVAQLPHPFDTIGEGLPAIVLSWLKGNGTYACHRVENTHIRGKPAARQTRQTCLPSTTPV